ncbi:unnamed protein product [Notodromas monacha]|uniref:Uncharacterized protein n=1 Tax=Notodromas monacha TaxID=399045 RepID=A0A7R9BXQ9_9CRUS|nr:unnamed protein product [Notodromas monacha]CAG0922057.1 unnamed protein product [Notodromas monacha]
MLSRVPSQIGKQSQKSIAVLSALSLQVGPKNFVIGPPSWPPSQSPVSPPSPRKPPPSAATESVDSLKTSGPLTKPRNSPSIADALPIATRKLLHARLIKAAVIRMNCLRRYAGILRFGEGMRGQMPSGLTFRNSCVQNFSQCCCMRVEAEFGRGFLPSGSVQRREKHVPVIIRLSLEQMPLEVNGMTGLARKIRMKMRIFCSNAKYSESIYPKIQPSISRPPGGQNADENDSTEVSDELGIADDPSGQSGDDTVNSEQLANNEPQHITTLTATMAIHSSSVDSPGSQPQTDGFDTSLGPSRLHQEQANDDFDNVSSEPIVMATSTSEVSLAFGSSEPFPQLPDQNSDLVENGLQLKRTFSVGLLHVDAEDVVVQIQQPDLQQSRSQSADGSNSRTETLFFNPEMMNQFRGMQDGEILVEDIRQPSFGSKSKQYAKIEDDVCLVPSHADLQKSGRVPNSTIRNGNENDASQLPQQNPEVLRVEEPDDDDVSALREEEIIPTRRLATVKHSSPPRNTREHPRNPDDSTDLKRPRGRNCTKAVQAIYGSRQAVETGRSLVTKPGELKQSAVREETPPKTEAPVQNARRNGKEQNNKKNNNENPELSGNRKLVANSSELDAEVLAYVSREIGHWWLSRNFWKVSAQQAVLAIILFLAWYVMGFEEIIEVGLGSGEKPLVLQLAFLLATVLYPAVLISVGKSGSNIYWNHFVSIAFVFLGISAETRFQRIRGQLSDQNNWAPPN